MNELVLYNSEIMDKIKKKHYAGQLCCVMLYLG